VAEICDGDAGNVTVLPVLSNSHFRDASIEGAIATPMLAAPVRGPRSRSKRPRNVEEVHGKGDVPGVFVNDL
jgi:hypothetical protein